MRQRTKAQDHMGRHPHWDIVGNTRTPFQRTPPPNQGSHDPRRGRGRGRGGPGFGAMKACYFCKREGHYMANCEELKSLKEK